MSPVVNVAAASAPPRNSSNITSSKARSQSARSYLHKQYLKVRLNRLQKHRPKGGLKSTLIHPSDAPVVKRRQLPVATWASSYGLSARNRRRKRPTPGRPPCRRVALQAADDLSLALGRLRQRCA